jgi:hypothetical protein
MLMYVNMYLCMYTLWVVSCSCVMIVVFEYLMILGLRLLNAFNSNI